MYKEKRIVVRSALPFYIYNHILKRLAGSARFSDSRCQPTAHALLPSLYRLVIRSRSSTCLPIRMVVPTRFVKCALAANLLDKKFHWWNGIIFFYFCYNWQSNEINFSQYNDALSPVSRASGTRSIVTSLRRPSAGRCTTPAARSAAGPSTRNR